jgi:hypothetical protein
MRATTPEVTARARAPRAGGARALMLAELMKLKAGLRRSQAPARTGKTTTTSLCGRPRRGGLDRPS